MNLLTSPKQHSHNAANRWCRTPTIGRTMAKAEAIEATVTPTAPGHRATRQQILPKERLSYSQATVPPLTARASHHDPVFVYRLAPTVDASGADCEGTSVAASFIDLVLGSIIEW